MISPNTGANYQYTGPTVESHASFEDIGRIEADGDPNANMEYDEQTVPVKKIVLGNDGERIIQDYIPVCSDDKIDKIDKEIKPQGNNNEQKHASSSKSSKERREVCQSFALVDVEDEILKEMLD